MKDLRVGIVGKRGASFYSGIRSVAGVTLSALCDLNAEWLSNEVKENEIEHAFLDFDQMLDHVDAVVIATPMHLHAQQVISALHAGKHVMSEVTACVTLEECWRILDAVKASGKTYMMSENYCYFEENVLVRELVKRGLFGVPYFAEGEYIHDVRFLHHNPDGTPTWRYYWQVGQNGNTYGTHQLGPTMQWFNAADPTEQVESVSCFGCGRHTDPEHPHDDTSLTMVKLKSGKLIKIRLDMMSNRPGMNFYSLQGTHGVYESAREYGGSAKVWFGENKSVGWNDEHRNWRPAADFNDMLPADYRATAELAKSAGHGGGDFYAVREFLASCLEERTPDIDVYQSLEWTAVGLCSQTSIENGGVPIRVPNFRDPSARPVWLDSPR